jgi:hypothetical protein
VLRLVATLASRAATNEKASRLSPA